MLAILIIIVIIGAAYLSRLTKEAQEPPREGQVLFLRPQWDAATEYGHYWFSLPIPYAGQKQWEATDLQKNSVTPTTFLNTLSQKAPILIMGCSHGNENTFTGQNGIPLLIACTNDQVLKDRIVYLLSCLTGVTLGPSMISKGCKGYLGFTKEFTWAVDTSYPVWEDPHAKPFCDFNEVVSKTLLDKQTVIKAHQEGIADFNKSIDEWGKVDDPAAAAVIQWLIWDRDCFIVLGSGAPTLQV